MDTSRAVIQAIMASSQLHIDAALADELEQIIGGFSFPWVWRSSSKYGMDMAGVVSKDFQFIHTIYANGEAKSDAFKQVSKLLSAFEESLNIKFKSIHRIKANLLPKQMLDSDGLAETVHADVDQGDRSYLTFVYYVINSDGDTFVYTDNGEVQIQATPKKGTAVWFPSHMQHRATPPQEHKRRIVLNIIVEI